MVLSLPGQSLTLCGHPSHVASCGSHSAGMVKPSWAGDGDVVRVACCVKCRGLAIYFANNVIRLRRATATEFAEREFALSTYELPRLFSLSPQRGKGRG